MADDPNKPVVLTTTRTEAQASMVAAALEEEGVRTQVVGGLTSGLRAEAPGDVRILVRQADYERGLAILRAIAEESAGTRAEAEPETT